MKRFLLIVIVLALGGVALYRAGLIPIDRGIPRVSFPAGQGALYEYDYTSTGSYSGMGIDSEFNITTVGILEVRKLPVAGDVIALGFLARDLKVSTAERTDSVPVAIPLVAYLNATGKIERFQENRYVPPVLSDHLRTFIAELQVVHVEESGARVLIEDSLGPVQVLFSAGDEQGEVKREKLEYGRLSGAGFGVKDIASIKKSAFSATIQEQQFWLEKASGIEHVLVTKNAGHTIRLQSVYNLSRTEQRPFSDVQSPAEFLAAQDTALKEYAKLLAEEVAESSEQQEGARGDAAHSVDQTQQ